MQHTRRLFYSVIAATMMCASCEKTINVNTPPYAHKLVLNSNAESNEPLVVSLSMSASIKDRSHNPDLFVRDATMKLYVDGVYSETMRCDSAGEYQSVQEMKPGKQYTVKVSEPTYEDISATVTVPSVVAITDIKRVADTRKDKDGNRQDALTITFTDPPAAGDYYIIKVNSLKDSVFYYSTNFCVNSSDAGIETFTSHLADVNTCLDNTGIFFRDELFNGKVKELKLYVRSDVIQPGFNGTDSLYGSVELWHVTEAYFRYSKSFKVADESNGDPFAEPVNVYSNVEKGFGIFSIASKDVRTVY